MVSPFMVPLRQLLLNTLDDTVLDGRVSHDEPVWLATVPLAIAMQWRRRTSSAWVLRRERRHTRACVCTTTGTINPHCQAMEEPPCVQAGPVVGPAGASAFSKRAWVTVRGVGAIAASSSRPTTASGVAAFNATMRRPLRTDPVAAVRLARRSCVP